MLCGSFLYLKYRDTFALNEKRPSGEESPDEESPDEESPDEENGEGNKKENVS